MSFENDIPFGVKASNVSSIASFASTLDDSYILVIANNCNEEVYNGNNYDTVYNDVTNAAVYGVNSSHKQQAYIGVKNDNILHKIATFDEDIVQLNVDTHISGNILPSSHAIYDIGVSNFAWRNIHAENVEAGFFQGDGSKLTNLDLTKYSVDDLKQGENNKFIENNTYYDNLTVDGGLNVKFLMINGVLFANSNDDIQSLFYSNLNFGNNSGGGNNNGGVIDTTGDVKIQGTLEVDDIIVNNHISILNKSVYSSECLDIVNYTDNPTFNIKQIGNGDVFKISNDYENIFTMKNNGFIGNHDNPEYELDIHGTIKSFNFRGGGISLTNVNLSDKSTSHLKEGVNKYYTDERVYNVLWGEEYFSSNPFIPYIDTVERNVIDSLDELRYAVYGINLDKIYQGSNNKYIVNNIYNNSLLVNGTLRVKNIEIIEEFEYDAIEAYNNGLYSNSNAISNYDFGAGRVTTDTVSNVIYGILSNVDLKDIYDVDKINTGFSNTIVQASSKFDTDITTINTDILNIVEDIQNLENKLIQTTLDEIGQGTSNKFIENDLYDSSLYVNGTLTVRNIEIVDIENFYEVFQTSLPETSDYFMNTDKVKNIIEEVLTIKNFEGQIDDKYELMSYALESEKTKLNIRINAQANEINILKTEINILTLGLQNAISRIEQLENT